MGVTTFGNDLDIIFNKLPSNSVEVYISFQRKIKQSFFTVAKLSVEMSTVFLRVPFSFSLIWIKQVA